MICCWVGCLQEQLHERLGSEGLECATCLASPARLPRHDQRALSAVLPVRHPPAPAPERPKVHKYPRLEPPPADSRSVDPRARKRGCLIPPAASASHHSVADGVGVCISLKGSGAEIRHWRVGLFVDTLGGNCCTATLPYHSGCVWVDMELAGPDAGYGGRQAKERKDGRKKRGRHVACEQTRKAEA